MHVLLKEGNCTPNVNYFTYVTEIMLSKPNGLGHTERKDSAGNFFFDISHLICLCELSIEIPKTHIDLLAMSFFFAYAFVQYGCIITHCFRWNGCFCVSMKFAILALV